MSPSSVIAGLVPFVRDGCGRYDYFAVSSLLLRVDETHANHGFRLYIMGLNAIEIQPVWSQRDLLVETTGREQRRRDRP
jgi:hypothetical protein